MTWTGTLDEIRQKHTEYMRVWRNSNRQMVRDINKRVRERLKLLVFTHYSNGSLVCAKCGFSDMRALSIDHINGGGRRHLATMSNHDVYRWLKLHNFPEGYQVLCMNCQFIKRHECNETPYRKVPV